MYSFPLFSALEIVMHIYILSLFNLDVLVYIFSYKYKLKILYSFYIHLNNGCHSGLKVLTQWCADQCNLGSLPTRDGLLRAVCMLLCMALGFAVLPGVLMCVSYMVELTV